MQIYFGFSKPVLKIEKNSYHKSFSKFFPIFSFYHPVIIIENLHFVILRDGRYFKQAGEKCADEQDKSEGYEARNAGTAVSARKWFPLWPALQESAWHTRYGIKETQDSDFCTRMLLAHARQLQICPGTQDEIKVVDTEI